MGNSAIDTASRNPDLIATSMMQNKEKLVERLKNLYSHIDEDGGGDITLAELETILKDEEMRAYFEAIGLDPQDAWTLFKLIDSDRTHTIDLDEFVSGILR